MVVRENPSRSSLSEMLGPAGLAPQTTPKVILIPFLPLCDAWLELQQAVLIVILKYVSHKVYVKVNQPFVSLNNYLRVQLEQRAKQASLCPLQLLLKLGFRCTVPAF